MTAGRVLTATGVRPLPRPAWRGIGVVAALDAALLLATAPAYGYDRDELYFRVLAAHPAWGYVDEPPLTPLIARAGLAVFGDNLWALRVPAMLFAVAAVVLTAVLARELGGGRPAQLLAAAGASCAFVLIAGHVLLTATPDLVVWLLVILFAGRALRRDEPRWWLAAGLTVGVGLYNKQLVALLVIALAIGLVVMGPRAHLGSRWLWAAAGLAVLVGLPNVVYQVTHGWPEVTMAGVIAAHKGHDDRVFFVPFQLVLLGVTLAPVWITGLVRVLRDPRFRAVRALGFAYPVVSALVVVSGGQPYYTFGSLAFLYAAGCVVTAEWATRRRRRWGWVGGAVGLSCATAVALALPVFPVTSLPAAVADVNQTAGDSVGWPTYVREVADVYRSLPVAQRSRAVIITANYGEDGAVARFGAAYRLPAVYSGQNELFDLGPPPARDSVVVLVGLENLGPDFAHCAVAAHLDDRVGVANEEQGRPITICRGPTEPWPRLWRDFQHYD